MSGYILIVESDPVLQRRIGDTLREARYELASEAEAAWARRSIAVRTPDAIVVDTMLSDGDGFRLAEDLRRDPETRNTPIFFVASRFRGAIHRAEARRRFAPAEYLPVPIDVNSLLALMLEAVPPARNGTPAAIHTAPTQPIPDAASQVTPPPVEAKPRAPAPRDPAQQRERRDVERSAKTLVMEKAELNGTLKKVPFGHLLQRLYSRRATGSLLLLRGTTKKIVSFVEGYPVAVRSNVLGECLGQILLGQKLISKQALTDSIKRMQKERRRQGEILVEMGALSPYNLTRALVEQAEAKLFEIFSWRDGQFMFKQGDAAPKEAMRLARPPAALILEGIRRHYDSARQVAVLDQYAQRFVALNADPVLRLQEMTADPTEVAFIRGINGDHRLEAVLDAAQIPRDKAGLLLVALSEAGMILPADAPTGRAAPPPPAGEYGAQVGTDVGTDDGTDDSAEHGADTGAQHGAYGGADSAEAGLLADGLGDLEGLESLQGLDDPADGGELESDRTAGLSRAEGRSAPSQAAGAPASVAPLGSGPLSMVAQTVRTQDYFWALGVTRAAATEEIDHAYEALARTFHADGYCNSPDDDRQMAQEIFDRLSEAHNVLRDPAQRRAYAEAIDRLNAEGIDRLNAEGIDRLNAEGIDRLNAEGIDRPDAEGIDRPDAEGTRSRANDGGGAAPATGATVPTSAGNAAATALYDSGMEHLKARRHHEAVEAFRQAARLVPGEADFRAALGWSLFREAPADARAGRAALGELRRALQIDSRNLRALHFLASFYAETGQPDLAIDELEKILQIAPNAPSADEAADQLRRLRQR